MGHIIAIIADCHINSTMGLSLPHLELDDGGTYQANRTQRWLWDCWRLFWGEVERLKQETGYPLLTIFNGDLAEGDFKGRTHQLVSRNKATTMRHVREILERPIQLSDWALFLRGTGSHVGKGGWMEEEIAQDYDIAIRNGECASWYSWRDYVGKLVIDVQHHSRLGGSPWTLANPLGALANRVETDAWRKGQPLPLVIRSHRHTYADSGNLYPVRCVVTPAWQATPEYLYRSDLPPEPNIGGIVVRIDDNGTWTLTPHLYRMKMPRMKGLPPLIGSRT